MTFTNDDAINQLPKKDQEEIKRRVVAEIEKYRKKGLLEESQENSINE